MLKYHMFEQKKKLLLDCKNYTLGTISLLSLWERKKVFLKCTQQVMRRDVKLKCYSTNSQLNNLLQIISMHFFVV